MVSPFSIHVEKYVGTGNDFVFLNEEQSQQLARLPLTPSEIARCLCDRHFGLGADGMIVIKTRNAGHVTWDFFNSDGSIAEMCGNATRCVGRWAERNLKLNQVELETAAGNVRIETTETNVVSLLRYISLNFKELSATVNGERKSAILVNTGVPHAVIELDGIEQASTSKMLDTIKAFRFHEGAGGKGANVTFLSREENSKSLHSLEFATVTFERGVEGFTLSCGTGVLAAAAVGLRAAKLDPQTELESAMCRMRTPGGVLSVSYGANWSGARLAGRADFIYKAEISSEILRS